MSISASQNRWLEKLVKLLATLQGVQQESDKNGSITLTINYNGKLDKIILTTLVSDIRDQKNQYSQVRNTLTKLGIEEGKKLVPAKRSRNPMTPEMVAARAAQQKEFDAWQEAWKIIRQAEMSLDREYEISIMKDYY
ncbi:MAG: hypothetical protein CMM75_06285 [Rhodospirillaceae bacterium]|nr:hypothetical protein [Rhodospirillaceae bacterium]|tara:strand:+ start:106 stop:516 length:411 start_codon:yes stop_codon:yes gene_type:complete